MRTSSKLHTRISLAIMAIGAVLMAGKMYADSEPGLLPLMLVAIGIIWFCFARCTTRSQKNV
ncbi:MAG: hypothetical protein V4693_06830 [Pseudomonadota bacterium]